MLKSGGDISVMNNSGKTPMYTYVREIQNMDKEKRHNYTELMEMMLDSGGKLDINDDFNDEKCPTYKTYVNFLCYGPTLKRFARKARFLVAYFLSGNFCWRSEPRDEKTELVLYVHGKKLNSEFNKLLFLTCNNFRNIRRAIGECLSYKTLS